MVDILRLVVVQMAVVNDGTSTEITKMYLDNNSFIKKRIKKEQKQQIIM